MNEFICYKCKNDCDNVWAFNNFNGIKLKWYCETCFKLLELNKKD